MGLWRRITPEDEKKTAEAVRSVDNPKEPPIEFYPEEPKYSFDEIILPQSVKEKNSGCCQLRGEQQKSF